MSLTKNADSVYRLHRGKRALSTAVSTMILLTSSIILAGTVATYTTNLSLSITAQGELQIIDPHLWVYDNGATIAGFAVTNSYGKDLSITKILVQGVASAWVNIYYCRLSDAIITDLNQPNVVLVNGANITYSLDSGIFVQGAADQKFLSLASGETVAIYIARLVNIGPNDLGTSTEIAIRTASAVYYAGCSVQIGNKP